MVCSSCQYRHYCTFGSEAAPHTAVSETGPLWMLGEWGVLARPSRARPEAGLRQ